MTNNLLNKKLVDTGKYLSDHKLTWGSSGNMSARINDDNMIITSSGTQMGYLKNEDLTKCNIFSGIWEGNKKPTKEVPMHQGIYKSRSDANVVLHSSPFYTTLIACSAEDVPHSLFIETMHFLDSIGTISYYHPGSLELGEAVEKEAEHSNIIIMKNHGVILFDNSFKNALMRLETLEMASRMIITAKSANINLKKLPDDIIYEFRQRGY